jgi:hypothetical protein
MLGASLKLSVKTSPLANWTNPGETNKYYFPAGNWCDIVRPDTPCILAGSNGAWADLPADIDQYQVSLRDGHIIPFQNAKALRVNTSEDLNNYNVDFIIHPRNVTVANNTKIYTASGVYVNDDGYSPLNQTLDGLYNHYTLSFQYRDQVHNNTDDEDIRLYIAAKVSATRMYNNETKCSAVNAGDLLGNIIIEDEVSLFSRQDYLIQVVQLDYTMFELGLMKFDKNTKRLSIVHKQPDAPDVCLTNIQEIRIVPAIV